MALFKCSVGNRGGCPYKVAIKQVECYTMSSFSVDFSSLIGDGQLIGIAYFTSWHSGYTSPSFVIHTTDEKLLNWFGTDFLSKMEKCTYGGYDYCAYPQKSDPSWSISGNVYSASGMFGSVNGSITDNSCFIAFYK